MVRLAQHEKYMRECIQLAQAAKDTGNIPVGSIVVKDGGIIARAQEILPNSLDVTGHAEILAVKDACQALHTMTLTGCILYTTAEPCWMCSYAIRETRISTVVIGLPTYDVGGLSTQYKLLSDGTIEVWDSPPEIIMGVLDSECAALRS